ncbi:MAG: c-type cytochrome, partial [Acidobacteria bacterium]|nr:c-type cytochrome [Acidobacteriota bacterium]
MRIAFLLAAAAGLFAQDPPPVYKQMCAGCHADNATGTDRGPGLLNARSLRRRSEAQIRSLIRNGTQGGMPAFPIADRDLDALARVIRSWNASVFEAKPAGDAAAGKRFFGANCAGCHSVNGVGGTNGPDLSEIAKELTLAELTQTLDNPNSRRGKRNSSSCPGWAFCPDDPYAVVNVKKKDGTSLRGFARARGAHDLQLQTLDGKFHLLQEREYASIVEEKRSLMPALQSTPAERGDLIAYLATLGGVPMGPVAGAAVTPTQPQID